MTNALYVKKHGTNGFLHTLRLYCKHRTYPRLLTASHRDYTHTQDRRHLNTGIPADEYRCISIRVAGIVAPAQYNMVDSSDKFRNMYMQLHCLYYKDTKRL